MPNEKPEEEMVEVIDTARIGTKGYPIHYKELGLQPPMKLVPKSSLATSKSTQPLDEPEE